MKFGKASIGERWYCPRCGARKTLSIESRYVARCTKCNLCFMVMVELLPDPNSQNGKAYCGQKHKHDTLESAFKHASELPELPHRARKQLSIYKCVFCQKFHVGHRGKIRRLQLASGEFYMYLDLEQQLVGGGVGDERKG